MKMSSFMVVTYFDKFSFQIFLHVKFPHKNIFVAHRNPRQLTAQSVCCRQILMHLIFMVCLPHAQNILTANISQIMVLTLY